MRPTPEPLLAPLQQPCSLQIAPRSLDNANTVVNLLRHRLRRLHSDRIGGRASTELTLGLLLASLFAFYAQPVHAANQERDRPTDPRVIEADALLSDDQSWRRAIELYEAVLHDDPGDDFARMWLARVLAWDEQYDRSLAHYDRFLDRHEPPSWAAVERAEVLSWAGRSDEAEAAFQALLAENPEDARAVRGLARVYQWSGRRSEAVRAYERALTLEDDAEARRDLSKLRSGTRPDADAHSRYFTDSDGFRIREVEATGQLGLDFRTKLTARARYTWVNTHRSGGSPQPPAAAKPDEAEALTLLAGAEILPTDALRLRAELGGTRWNHARNFVTGDASAEYTFSDRLTAEFGVSYGDFLARSDSLDAVLEGIWDTTLRASSWVGVRADTGLYSYVEASFLGDGNRRLTGGASLDYQPWQRYELRFVADLGLLGYTRTSNLYYDPSFSAEGSLGLSGSLPLFSGLALEADAGAGYGYAEQDGSASHGFAYRVRGGPVLELAGLRLRAIAFRTASIRSTTYTTWGVELNLGGSF